MSKQTSRCVYRITDKDGSLLYVGCSYAPLMRVQEHCQRKSWGPAIHNITVEWFDTPEEAIAAETLAIQTEAPIWNVHRKPDGRKRARGIYDREYKRDDPSSWAAS